MMPNLQAVCNNIVSISVTCICHALILSKAKCIQFWVCTPKWVLSGLQVSKFYRSITWRLLSYAFFVLNLSLKNTDKANLN